MPSSYVNFVVPAQILLFDSPFKIAMWAPSFVVCQPETRLRRNAPCFLSRSATYEYKSLLIIFR